MLPGIGWTELLVIVGLAIIVVGPKDLPRVMRAFGHFLGKARAVAREFQQSFEEIAREADLEELRKETGNIARSFNEPLKPLPAIPLTESEEAEHRERVNAGVLATEKASADAGGEADAPPADGPAPETAEQPGKAQA